MTWKESLKWQAKEKAYLDTLDLKPFIKKDKSIYDIMSEIEDKYNDGYTEESDMFNHLDHWDVINYLRNRYKINFYTYEDQRVQ